MKVFCSLFAAALLALAAMATPALAETIQGTSVTYRDDGAGSANVRHFTGTNAFGEVFHGGLVFAIPVGNAILDAQLVMTASTVLAGPNTVAVYEMTTSGAVLLAAGGGVATYTDLGDGAVYGTASGLVTNSIATVTLSPAAVAAINAAQGGTFAVGLVNATHSGGVDYIFESAGGPTPRDLVLTRAVPVPALSEWGMIFLGILLAGGAAFYIQRRQFAG